MTLSFKKLNDYTEKVTGKGYNAQDISIDDLLSVASYLGMLKFRRTYDFNTDLMHLSSEISEVFEEWRDGRTFNEFYYKKDKHGREKPEGIPIELADVIIKALGIAEKYDIDLTTAIQIKLSYIAGKDDK